MTTSAEYQIQSRLRALPAVDLLMRDAPMHDLIIRYGRMATLDSLRAVLDDYRETIRKGGEAPMPALVHDDIRLRVEAMMRPTLYPLINATGVILHTNLGRAPLSPATLKAMQDIGGVYSNLEYDVANGERGSRYSHTTRLLTRLTGAEDALVVNNCAAALMLCLAAMARGREVIISRGQLVEIGGGFRIPEIMEQSGAKLVEVGATNRTRIADFESALSPQTAMLLRVHSSNFRIVGFAESATLAEMAALARRHNLVVLDDLGSGTLLDTAQFGLAHEPTPMESLEAGAGLVCFSGDKLLGGPQAGLIVGRKDAIARLRKHPMTRALRVDKLTLAGLQATLLHYMKEEATKEIPIWRMIAAQPERLRERATRWHSELTGGSSSPSARAAARGSGEAAAAEGIDFRTPSFGPSGEAGLAADPKGLSGRGGAATAHAAGPVPQAAPAGARMRAAQGEGRAPVGDWEIIDGQSTVGGGSLPEESLPTVLLAYAVESPNAFAARLRRSWPPVIARVENDRVLFDPRTVLDEQDAQLLNGIRSAQRIP